MNREELFEVLKSKDILTETRQRAHHVLSQILYDHEEFVKSGGRRGALANLSKVSLVDANLSSAQLSGIDLSFADLRYADLSRADLRGANLKGANLKGAKLKGAKLFQANLEDATVELLPLCGADWTEGMPEPEPEKQKEVQDRVLKLGEYRVWLEESDAYSGWEVHVSHPDYGAGSRVETLFEDSALDLLLMLIEMTNERD